MLGVFVVIRKNESMPCDIVALLALIVTHAFLLLKAKATCGYTYT